MIPAQREAFIIEKLRQDGVVKTDELAKYLNVTQMTIRRDLLKIEKDGLAYRSHGGAVLKNPLQREELYDKKKQNNLEEKRNIALKAVDLINDGDIVLLDSGTTVYELALLLKDKEDLTVVTPDLKIANELYQSNIKVFFIGGQIQKETGSSMGSAAEEFVKGIKVNIAFIGISSIDSNLYLCTPTFEKAALKNKMIACASKSVLLSDESKFEKGAFTKICSIEEIDVLITNRNFTAKEKEILTKIDTKIIKI